ncbi:MAG: CCXG family PEP-CTERM protein [Pseudomonadota bacterium]
MDRVEITVTNPTASALTNYSAKIELNATNAPSFNFAGTGNDIAILDSTPAALDFYIESIDSGSNTAVIWVEVPSIPAGGSATFNLDYNYASSPFSSSASDTFATNGYKFHTQFYNGIPLNPANRTDGESLFDFETVAAPGSGYGCDDFTSAATDNSSPFGSNNDVGYFFETLLEVSTTGTYQFRLGPDFGDGGELYVNGTTVEADWGNDLWWAFSYANPAETLSGSIFLNAGVHTVRALGFERCCDGAAGLQWLPPGGGAYVDLTTSTSGATLYAPSCPVANITFAAETTVPVTLARFSSSKTGPYVKLQWDTADETFNAGFNVWTYTEQQELIPINRRLIRSHSFESIHTLNYEFEFNTNRNKSVRNLNLDNLVVSSMDVNGKEEFFGPFAIGEEYGSDFSTDAIDWLGVREEVAATMLAKGYVWRKNRWLRDRINESNDGGDDQLLVNIAESGIHRVTFEDIANQGLDWQGVDINQISVSYNELGIPRRIKRSAGKLFGPGSYIDFVAYGPSGASEIYSDTRSYVISLQPDKVLTVPTVRNEVTNPVDQANLVVRFDQPNEYIMFSPGDSPWLHDILFQAGQSVSSRLEFLIDDEIAQEATASLEVTVAGLSDLAALDLDGDGNLDSEHRFAIKINDTQVGSLELDGQEVATTKVDFPTTLVTQGMNDLDIELQDTGYVFSMAGIDSAEISVPIEAANTPFLITGFEPGKDGFVFDRTNKRGLIAYAYDAAHNLTKLRIKRQAKGRFAIPLTQKADATHVVLDSTQLLKPQGLQSFSLGTTPVYEPLDLLVITDPAFDGEILDNYLSVRRANGLNTVKVSTEEIQSIYGLVDPVHQSVKQFISDVASSSAIDAVLLVGGHTYDYNGYNNDEAINFIPAFYHPVGIARFTPTDNPFADIDDNGYPDLAVGRWPVRSLDDLAAIAAKSLQWLDNSEIREVNGHNLLLVADRTTNLPFTEDINANANVLLNSDLNIGEVESVFIDDYLSDPAIDPSTLNETLRSDVKTLVGDFASWMVYNGHASPASWSANNLIRAEDIASLGNNLNPVLITSMGCYSTYYEHPTYNSIAHQMLFASEAGAVAIHGPSVVGDYAKQTALAQLISEQSSDKLTVGEAILRGKQQLPINYMSVIPNWTLLGDPSLPIQ